MAPMIVLFCLATAAVLIAVGIHLFRARHQRDEVTDLRGDWWPAFEAEFRAYAARWEASRAQRRRPASP
jgi:hypothetical protein